MAETLAQTLVELFQDKIPPELTAFVISLLPILECRGGMIAARLLQMPFLKAFVICYRLLFCLSKKYSSFYAALSFLKKSL